MATATATPATISTRPSPLAMPNETSADAPKKYATHSRKIETEYAHSPTNTPAATDLV